MSDEGPAPEEAPAGSPAWVMTFADLMSLLMCFFVLLLSFAEMDVLRFKQLAGSMKVAFGVQRRIIAPSIPKGTSIVAREFSPGKPEPTLLEEIKQTTTDEEKKRLDVLQDEKTKAMKEKADKIGQVMAQEIKTGRLEVELEKNKIIIRILEKGAFPQGGDEFHYEFIPIMEKLRAVLAEVKGDIQIAGHTDNMPVYSERHRSNWDLSAARASTVAQTLLEDGTLDRTRFSVSGHADTKPRMSNDTEEGRILNRRVEIVIHQSQENNAEFQESLKDLDGIKARKSAEEAKQKAAAQQKAKASEQDADIKETSTDSTATEESNNESGETKITSTDTAASTEEVETTTSDITNSSETSTAAPEAPVAPEATTAPESPTAPEAQPAPEAPAAPETQSDPESAAAPETSASGSGE